MYDNKDEEARHLERVKIALENMPSEEGLGLMSAWFKALSEPSRLKILFVLAGGELCVDHITDAVGGNQSAVSHQLKILKDCRILKCKRAGKNVLYSLSDEHVIKIMQSAKEHLSCDE